MTNVQTRAKFAYLKYESMMLNLKDETLDSKKRLNAYDINFAPDTKECYVIAPDLTPWAIKSKVYTFDSIESANEKLNQNTDTYVGQVIAILYGNKYQGYIVNEDDNGKFYASPLYESSNINYDELGNRPIINLVGTLDEPIMVSDLETGVYKIKGQYKITDLEETIYLSASNTLFIVQKDTNVINIKKITSDDITDYSIIGDSFVSNIYITDKYLEENGYTTVSYVDSKVEAAKVLLEEELKIYISGMVESAMNDKLDEKIDEKINDYIQPTDNEQITNLFS